MNRETALEMIDNLDWDYNFKEINSEEAMEIMRHGAPIYAEPCFYSFAEKTCTDFLLCYEMEKENNVEYLLLKTYSDDEVIRFAKRILSK